jgi:DNA-binding response OmpR family regulator
MATILYAEDDDDLSALIVRWLESKSHKVQLVKSGVEALEFLEFERYDLILLDWNLPDGNGISICETLRSQNITTPVIMLTGSSESAAKQSGIKAGANQVFYKPPDLKELGASIDSLSTPK